MSTAKKKTPAAKAVKKPAAKRTVSKPRPVDKAAPSFMAPLVGMKVQVPPERFAVSANIPAALITVTLPDSSAIREQSVRAVLLYEILMELRELNGKGGA